MMTVPSQLESARIGGNLTLRCKSEAFPASINYWVRGQRAETVTSGPRLRSYSLVQDHVTHMKLEIVRSGGYIECNGDHIGIVCRWR